MFSSVPAGDRINGRTNPWAIGTAALVNGAFLALLLSLGVRAVVSSNPKPALSAPISIEALKLFTAPHLRGGQGGGENSSIEASRGRLPQIEKTPLAPPQIPILDHPKLAIRDAMTAPQYIKLPNDPSLPSVGLLHSSNVTVISGGPGARSGIGSGDNGGVGPGHGIGFGPGNGDGVYTPGGDVSAPLPIFTPEAEFSDEARRQKFQGVCMISIVVDAHGNPQNPRVIQPLGMGLDEKALEAVRKYRFKPAIRHGKPVASRISVAVIFRLF